MRMISYKNKPTHIVLNIRDKTVAFNKEVIKCNFEKLVFDIGVGFIVGVIIFLVVIIGEGI